jgi:hypothetical protein
MKGFVTNFLMVGWFITEVFFQHEQFFNTYSTCRGYLRGILVWNTYVHICEARWLNAAVPGSNPSLTSTASGKLLTVPGVGTHVRIYITVYISMYIYICIFVYICGCIFTQVMESSGCRMLFWRYEQLSSWDTTLWWKLMNFLDAADPIVIRN